ncbi:thiamine-phosphate kinase [Corynebacterium sp. H113]|uniref:thiamine-phosphate kinase n=1 Tax=Corynebacterium sp. H113 TaxID=3133419 RepID=UPI0040403EE2
MPPRSGQLSHVSIGELGELKVISEIRKVAPSKRNGDDAAVLAMTTPNARYVASTDMLVEERHFTMRWSTPQQIGAKAAIQNFADVEAMGARPTAILFGISAPPETPLGVLTGIARGLYDEGRKCAADLVGGDIVSGDNLVVSITAMGELGGPLPPLWRGGARPGDTLIAAGPIGKSAAGFAMLQHFGSPAKVPGEFAGLVGAHLVPEFSYGRGPTARAAGAVSLTDNSDGLVVDLGEIARMSGVSVDVDKQAIAPDEEMIRAGEVLSIDPWEWVLRGGEDHTLLGSIPGEPPTGFRAIGRVLKEGEEHVTIDGERPWLHGGWVSF